MNAQGGSRREISLKLIPQLWRLITHVPLVVAIPRREIPLFGTAPLLIGAHPHNHARIWLGIDIQFISVRRVIKSVARPVSGQSMFQGFRLKELAAHEKSE